VKSLSFDQKRIVVGIVTAIFLIVAGNNYLEWGLFGAYAKAVMFGVMLVMLVGFARHLPAFQVEMKERIEAQRAAEAEAELLRDKSGDEAKAARLRQAIGMEPPNKSFERTREG
jgi:hypothetical protein